MPVIINGVEFVNLTPHEIVLFLDEKAIAIPSDGKLRLKEHDMTVDESPFPLVVRRFSLPDDFPEPKEGRMFIVSLPLLLMLKMSGIERDDFVAPDTGSGAVRDDKGRISGTKQFIKV